MVGSVGRTGDERVLRRCEGRGWKEVVCGGNQGRNLGPGREK